MRLLRLGVVTLCVTMLAAPAPARAQGDGEGDPDASVQLKRRADELANSGKPAEALPLYEQAYKLKPDAAILYNHGRTLETMGRSLEALEKLEKFDREASPETKRQVPALDRLLLRLGMKVAKITVRCNVDGAEIRVRNVPVGVTPQTAPIRIDAGPAPIEVRKEGYFTKTHVEDLPGGAESTLEFNLAAKATSGVLFVESNVPGTQFSVDGEAKGLAPTDLPLPAGRHWLVFSHEGYKSREVSRTIDAGTEDKLSVTLDKEASLVTKWWFWTIVGVAAAGGVATVYALTTERSPGSGDLNPGTVRTPLFKF
jgi:hypothetical protein